MEILNELNYRKKIEKYLDETHEQNKSSLLKQRAHRMHDNNIRAHKVFEKMKEKERHYFEDYMQNSRNRTIQNDEKQDRIEKKNSSFHKKFQ